MSLTAFIRHLVAASVLAACAAASAQTPPTADLPEPGALRRSIAERPDYNPYALQMLERAATDEAMKLWREGQRVEAHEKVRALLSTYPASLWGHRLMRDIFERLAESATDPAQKAEAQRLHEKHGAYMIALFRSIQASGDGLTPETAYWVVTIAEEYALLGYLGYRMKTQALVHKDGKSFDVLVAVDKEGKERSFHFDVTHFTRNLPR